MGIRIVTDSTCDLHGEITRQRSITVVPLAIHVGDTSFVDGTDLARSEFYAQLLNVNPHLKTAAPVNMGKASAHRTRTRKRATARLLEWLAEHAPYERLAMLRAGVQHMVKALYQQARPCFPQGAVLIAQITPVPGAHLGMGALGSACISKE